VVADATYGQRRVPAMVNGAGDHTVYAHAGQCSAQEQSTLRSRSLHLSSRKQQLPRSGRSAPQFRRLECQESNPCLHRKPQALRGVSAKAQCTTGQYKYLAIHIHEPARPRARELARTPAFAHFQRERKKVEALFAELKNQIGLRRLRLRRLKFVRQQFFLAAAAQNIKRLVRFLRQGPQPPLLQRLSLPLAGNSSSPPYSHATNFRFRATLFQHPQAFTPRIQEWSFMHASSDSDARKATPVLLISPDFAADPRPNLFSPSCSTRTTAGAQFPEVVKAVRAHAERR